MSDAAPIPEAPLEASAVSAGELSPAHQHSGKLLVRVGIVLFFLMLAIMATARIYVPRFVDAKRRANELACVEQLRQIGVAARQYAGDRKTFPHVGPPDQLDGGIETPDTPLAFQALVAGGYLEDVDLLTCPSTPRRRGEANRADWRAWVQGKAELPPPPFHAAKWLSYAWTRRQLDLNSPGSALLSADRAAIPRRGEGGLKGNHTGGWSVLRVDGTSEFLSWDAEPFPGGYLGATEDPARDGFLSVRSQPLQSAFDPEPTDGSGESYWPGPRRGQPPATPAPSRE